MLGGHAVIEMTQGIPALPPDDTTRDGDLGVIPQLLSDDPNLSARMTELGYEAARPERPGVWSPISQRDRHVHDRDSIDFIAPMSLARGDLATNRSIRAARVGAHGRHAVSATRGTELSVIDRQWRTLRSFDRGPTVDAYVAVPSSLLCAKAHKIHDRLDPAELRRKADRLRPKDFADLYRLLVMTPEGAASVFARGIAEPRISDAVALGHDHLVENLADANMVANALLLRSDVHTLYDRGYLGIDADLRLRVSPALRARGWNGVEFYEKEAAEFKIRVPENPQLAPDRDALAWHHKNHFRAA